VHDADSKELLGGTTRDLGADGLNFGGFAEACTIDYSFDIDVPVESDGHPQRDVVVVVIGNYE